MWSLMGDLGDRPAGTHYYARAEQVTYFWNMFDQVLLRPELASRLVSTSPKVITRTQTANLIQHGGVPDRTNFSDHLPIFFELDLALTSLDQ
jgi:hypothetical protein